MSDENASGDPGATGGNEAGVESGDEAGEDEERPIDRRVERSFTCVFCGYAMVHEVAPLQAEVQSVCHNCGDWTAQTADVADLVDAAQGIADALAGETLTERQALAFLLRERLNVDRDVAAEAMDSTPSNVDNLQRRAVEKVEDAERVVAALESLRADGDQGEESGASDDRDDGNGDEDGNGDGDQPGSGPRRP